MKREKMKEIIEWIVCIFIAVVLAICVRYFLGIPTKVQMTSMVPTLQENDRLLVVRTNRLFKQELQRGDIITFEAPSKLSYTKEEIDLTNPVAQYEEREQNIISSFCYNVLDIGKRSYIKRVIALPGEHVQIKEGKVFVNNEVLQEGYLPQGTITDIKNGFDDFVVPENCVFAMGDNRGGSMDCREFGCIPMEKIEGKVVFRFWPLTKFGKVE